MTLHPTQRAAAAALVRQGMERGASHAEIRDVLEAVGRREYVGHDSDMNHGPTRKRARLRTVQPYDRGAYVGTLTKAAP